MDLWKDLSPQEAEYYSAENPRQVSQHLERYLDNTRNPHAMPDLCYEICRTEVDAVLSKLEAGGTDMCDGDELQKASDCLENTKETGCISSRFLSHTNECDREKHNTTTRVLDTSEDDVELSENAFGDAEMLVNQTRSLIAANMLGKSMVNLFTGAKKMGVTKALGKMASKNGHLKGGMLDGFWCQSTWFVPSGGPLYE